VAYYHISQGLEETCIVVGKRGAGEGEVLFSGKVAGFDVQVVEDF